MARTDKTDPFWVKTWTGALAHRQVHDHTDGVCDLPATIAEHYEQLDRPLGTKCHWAFVYTGTRTCGCWLCRGRTSLNRRHERRADAEEVRRLIRDARQDWRSME
jgi:hypothetical protein